MDLVKTSTDKTIIPAAECNATGDACKGGNAELKSYKDSGLSEAISLIKERNKDDPEHENTLKEIDMDKGKNLRFGIDVILQQNGTVNKHIPLNLINKQLDYKGEIDYSHENDEKGASDRESDDCIDNEIEECDTGTSNSSLAALGLHPQLSVLIRSNNSASFGSNLSLFPPSLQMGAVGLHWSSVNDVRKDRFGCKYRTSKVISLTLCLLGNLSAFLSSADCFQNQSF